MSSSFPSRARFLVPVLVSAAWLGIATQGCGGDTIGDNFGFDAAVSRDATVADTGAADSALDGQVDGAASCTTGLSACGAACVDELSDGANCGGCGVVCSNGQVCNAGSCAVACNGGTTACGASCVNPLTDVNNCGACGTTCGAGLSCIAGKCGLSCAAGLTQCGTGAASIGTNDGGVDAGDAGVASDAGSGASACVDTLFDRNNCGGCGVICTSGQVCSNGACAASCQPGLVQCGQTCVDPLSTTAYCGVTSGCAVVQELPDGGIDAGGIALDGGSVGVACAAGEVCSGGTCQITCAANEVNCGTRGCVDPLTNGDFCGAAGNCTNVGSGNSAGSVCPSGETCNGEGVCTVTCQAGQVKCGNLCVDPLSNGSFCGASGNCTNDMGMTIVDGVAESDSMGAQCAGGTVCTKDTNGNGTCQVGCIQGQVDCNGRCIDPTTSETNCGAAGNCSNDGKTTTLGGTTYNDSKGQDCSALAGTVCNGAGSCQTSCQAGEVLCNQGHTCVDPKTSETYCGATAGCGDVGGSAGTICTGNQVCSTINGVTGCNTSCAAGYVDCHGTCIDPLRDNGFCGASADCSAASGTAGASCGAGTRCQQDPGTGKGTCETSCPANLALCSNFCVDEQNDPANCGTCAAAGGSCAPAANSNVASEACVTGMCAIGSCSTGFADCNGTYGDGCEVDTTRDAQNCGACGHACGTGQACASSLCYPTTASCAALHAAAPTLPSGVYLIQPAGVATAFAAYCDMTNDGGGWTLVMKLAGDATLAYTASYWTSGAPLNAADLTLTPGTDSVYASYPAVPLTQIRGILDGYSFLFTPKMAYASAAALFTNDSNDYVNPYPAAYANDPNPNWGLQPYCHVFGVNISLGGAQSRFGWQGNENAPTDCGSNDSVDGFGTFYGGNLYSAGYFDIDDPNNPAGHNAAGNGTLWVK